LPIGGGWAKNNQIQAIRLFMSAASRCCRLINSSVPCGIILAWVGIVSGTAAADAPRKPNSVFILADDLGYGDARCYNAQSKIPTPNLDRLAAEGIRFTDAHAPDAVCTPSILPALLGKKLKRPIREATVLHSATGHFAIRQDDWVLIDASSGDGGGHDREPDWFKHERGYTTNSFPGELYNLRKDLAERVNRYGEKPEVVARLKALLEKYKADGRSAPGAAEKLR